MPSSTFTLFNSFLADVANGVHNLGGDQLVVALCAAANAPVAATDGQLSDLTTIAYTNLSSRNLTTTSSSQVSGTYKLILADLNLAASGGDAAAFRYIVIYNDTATNDELIGYLDYGSDVVIADGESIDIDFDATNGVLQATEA